MRRDNVRRVAESHIAERRLRGEASRGQCLHRALDCPRVAGEGLEEAREGGRRQRDSVGV